MQLHLTYHQSRTYLGQTCHLFRQVCIAHKYREWEISCIEIDRKWLDTYLVKHPPETLSKIHKLTVQMHSYRVELLKDPIATIDSIEVWQIIFDLFVSVRQVNMVFHYSPSEYVKTANSGFWRHQAELWSRLPNPSCDFDISLSVNTHINDNHPLPCDILQPLESLKLKKFELLLNPHAAVASSVAQSLLSIKLPENLTRCENVSLQLPLQEIDLVQRTRFSASALTTVTTFIRCIDDFHNLLAILGRVAHTLRKLVLHERSDIVLDMLWHHERLVTVHLPRLRSLELKGYEIFRLGLLNFLGAPMISTIHLDLVVCSISAPKAESLRYIGGAQALTTVSVECLYHRADGEELTKVLFQIKEALLPSVKYSIFITFEEVSWINEVVKPQIRQYFLPIIDHVVHLSSHLHLVIMTEGVAAQEHALASLEEHRLHLETRNDTVGTLQQHFELLTLPCMVRLELNLYRPIFDGVRDHSFDPELVKTALGCIWSYFPIWPRLELVRFIFFIEPYEHVFDTTSVIEDITRACHSFGIRWEWSWDV